MVMHDLYKQSCEAQQAYYGCATATDFAIAASLLHALVEESIEALRYLPMRKAWSTNKATLPTDMHAYTEELADILLFLFAVLYWSGISYDQFVQVVQSKQQTNKTRSDHAN